MNSLDAFSLLSDIANTELSIRCFIDEGKRIIELTNFEPTCLL